MSVAGTFAFGDVDSGRFGLAHVVVTSSGEPHALAVVCAGGEPAAQSQEAAQVQIDEIEPARAWRVAFAGDGAAFDLEFSSLGDPVSFADGEDQLCRATGTVTAAGATEPIACLGQRAGGGSHPPVDGALVRWLGAWLGEDEAVLARASRGAGDNPEDESIEAYLFEGEPPVALAVADPRLSTQYAADGRHERAGLELWVSEEDDYPHRAAGQLVCATSFHFGPVRLDCAFLHWRMHGREGAGVYNVLRPA